MSFSQEFSNSVARKVLTDKACTADTVPSPEQTKLGGTKID